LEKSPLTARDMAVGLQHGNAIDTQKNEIHACSTSCIRNFQKSPNKAVDKYSITSKLSTG
jgi:hypothetical protein